ncbi:M20 aminoacylase family protein [Rhizobium bangladeshense]|uniref:M20 aminoacylase family protein n=1 Tax=Rhizobium bangladeshense TaxID=1138189 RepID=UPI001C82986C|nr:M20 aminoacylase family protein [Rhizobium bangladeshense]MBX4917451.1 amidohydrolase [Rhizobium bangladeshense]
MHDLKTFRPLVKEATKWRRHLHQHPELDYDLHSTAAYLEGTLRSFGVNHIETGLAETGLVALIEGNHRGGPTIGLRAEMDAVRIEERSNKPWSSKMSGRMHACGHDGHMAMLLGAAKFLVEAPNFGGTVALIFQPAEENALGGQRMVQEGIMDRFGISRVFAMDNSPGLDVGRFAICDGPFMAALDEFDIVIKGQGGHAASPHRNIDPIVIAGQIIVGLQPLVSRSTNPLESLVVSITKMHAGESYNVIPETATLSGTVRTLKHELRGLAETRIPAVARGIASGYGAEIEFKYRRLDPIMTNSPEETNLAISAARNLVGPICVDDQFEPVMGSEDFAFMLEARPGAMIFIGNGSTASLHNPTYDFNDEALPYGIGYWANLVKTVLPGPL